MNDLVNFIVQNYGWVTLVITIIVLALTEAIKIPFKMLTGKIKNEKLRKLANKSIILISFGLAFLCHYVASLICPAVVHFGTGYPCVEGAFANLFYALGEGVITLGQAGSLAKQIKNISDDPKNPTVTDETKQDAVNEFNKLIGK
jgi:hypothetical protein